MGKLDALQPAAVWRIFEMMSDVPRGSGNEAAVQGAFKAWADQRGLAWKEDAVGNLLISIPATAGLEKAPTVLIQGHVDMVCEKNAATKHDFTSDPIRLKIEGDWVTAEGTTLGADNGIGCAMGLALADAGVPHGPVEVLLTVDEERGLTGAANVQKGFFSARTMINLDSEQDDAIFIGCAGGRDTEFVLKNRGTRAPKDSAGRKVTIRGLKGGHSGLDIHKGRGNAIRILVRALQAARDEMDVRIVEINGGSMRNAIPREAEARVVVPAAQGRRFKQLVDAACARIAAEELKGVDDGFTWAVASVQAPRCLTLEASRTVLDLMAAIPNGVLAMSRDIAGLVETSSNLGVVKTDGASVRLVCCSRSSVMASLDAVVRQHAALGALAGAEVRQPEGYPGWKPNLQSKVLAATRARYAATFGHDPELLAIHAGLECGLLTEKYPDLDIVSFGPNITGAHSPDEKVQVSSVQKIWTLFSGTMAALAKA
ncbi:MAG TPA: aminoacyl-histidine dipeptidase [Candidatus Krumholzibacteria bacterium]|nr:aminoacyl-histidine dipeptidase [Candidatus Krumholzibacteria bacterium]